MSTFFISDLHLGHKRILEFSPERVGESIDEHDEWIVSQWNSVVKSPKDLVWVCGDVCFDRSKLHLLDKMKGRKKLIRGNHDTLPDELYYKYFENIYGIHKRYHRWITHAPIHPESLRSRQNIHGHVHSNSVNDSRYINVCVEVLHGIPLKLEDL